MSVNKQPVALRNAYQGAIHHGAADGNLSLGPNDLVALVVPPDSGTTVVTLPSVHEAKGRFYTVISNGDAIGDIDVVGKGDELVAYASGALTLDKDYVFLYCDGVMWHEIKELTSP